MNESSETKIAGMLQQGLEFYGAGDFSRAFLIWGEVLELEVDSPVWSQQLQLRKPELLAALERAFGADAPRELRFQVGYARSR